MASSEWVVHPHGKLVEVKRDFLYTVAGTQPRMPPRTMAVVKLARDEVGAAGLIIYAPICVDESVLAAIRRLGPVKFGIVPSAQHTADVRAWAHAFPGARWFAPGGSLEAARRVVECGDIAELEAEVGSEYLFSAGAVPGWKGSDCWVRSKGALLLGDVLFNLPADWTWGLSPSPLGRAVSWLLGSSGSLKVSRLGYFLMTSDSALLSRWLLNNVQGTDTLVVCHGAAIVGADAVRIAMTMAANKLVGIEDGAN